MVPGEWLEPLELKHGLQHPETGRVQCLCLPPEILVHLWEGGLWDLLLLFCFLDGTSDQVDVETGPHFGKFPLGTWFGESG